MNRLPLRVDIVVLRLLGEPVGEVRKLHSIFEHLRPHTLIEHKGPTDDIEAEDLLALIAYASQYMRLVRVFRPDELCLMVVCDHITKGFRQQVERHKGTLACVGEGLWRGELAGFPLHGVETRDACRGSRTERLLYAFSRAYVADPDGILPLDPEEKAVYDALYQQVEQFRAERGPMAMKDFDLAQKSYEEVNQRWLETLPLEKRLRGLTPEQRLAGLTREEIAEMLKTLPPEVEGRRLAELSSEEIVKILKVLSPEKLAELAKRLMD